MALHGQKNVQLFLIQLSHKDESLLLPIISPRTIFRLNFFRTTIGEIVVAIRLIEIVALRSIQTHR